MAPSAPRWPCVRRLGGGQAAGGRGEADAVEVNSPEGIPFESDGFRGRFVLLHRPEHPDEPCAYSEHLNSTGRVFEFRVQGVFTREPGDAFFAGEVIEGVGLSWAMHLTLSWLMAVVRGLVAARGSWIYFNPELLQLEGGKTERPHLVWRCNLADVVIATPLGETPPPIGRDFSEPSDQTHRGKKLDTEHTYTFIFHADVLDFIRWELCNLPFGLCGPVQDYIGSQNMRLCLYTLRGGEEAVAEDGAHAEENKDYLLQLEVSRPKDLGEENAAAAAAAAEEVNRGTRRHEPSCWCGPAMSLHARKRSPSK